MTPLSILFRTQGWLTFAQLTRKWGRELAKAEEADHCIQDLRHILLVDILNGHLDDSGPLVGGQRLGLRLITPENKAGFIEGHRLLEFTRNEPGMLVIMHKVVIMKEAALDFARRHKLPVPTWWMEDSYELTINATSGLELGLASPPSFPTAPARPRGRRPEKRAHVEWAMKRDIQQGRQTVEGLKDMPQKTLAGIYGVSRETARKALAAVESNMSRGTQSP